MSDRFKHYLGRIIDRFVAPWVPPPYRLGLHFHKSTVLLGWEPEVRRMRQYGRGGAVAIDVGANMGLWSYGMVQSGLFQQVLAFEPNPNLTQALDSAGFCNLTLMHQAVSNTSGSSVLRIPKRGALLLGGWASLEDQIDLTDVTFDELRVPTIRLDDLHLQDVGLIKIDVEGHELKVLEGARGLLTKFRPPCVVECRDRNRMQVEDFFCSLGVDYHAVDTLARFGFQFSAGNYLFCAP